MSWARCEAEYHRWLHNGAAHVRRVHVLRIRKVNRGTGLPLGFGKPHITRLPASAGAPAAWVYVANGCSDADMMAARHFVGVMRTQEGELG